MSRQLVFERQRVAFAIAQESVRGLVAAQRATAVVVDAAALVADAVHGWVDLAVRPAPATLARYWGEPCAGLAAWRGRPVVVVDPGRPPEMLIGRVDDEGVRPAQSQRLSEGGAIAGEEEAR